MNVLKRLSVLASAAITLLLLTVPAPYACDTCGLYCPAGQSDEITHGWLFGMSSQYTRSGTIIDGGLETTNESGEYLSSSLTQVFAGYDFSSRVSVQVNIPVLYRAFRRLEFGDRVNRTVSGVGDAIAFATVTPFRHQFGETQVQWKVLGGLKLPTGSSTYLREEDFHGHGKDDTTISAIHGRDITLGTGSWDVIVGTDAMARWKNVFLTGNVQYSLRGTGTIDYRYGNDLSWRGGPGVRFLGTGHVFAVQALFSGEHKDDDIQLTVPKEGTGRQIITLGPLVTASWKRVAAEVGFGLPLHIDQRGLDAVPDYRVRLGISWQLR